MISCIYMVVTAIALTRSRMLYNVDWIKMLVPMLLIVYWELNVLHNLSGMGL